MNSLGKKKDPMAEEATTSSKILKQIVSLYEEGFGGGVKALGLKHIADDPLVGLPIRKPRRKIR